MLTAHWTFDLETLDGRKVADATGSGLIAELGGAAEVVPGRAGQALALAGTGGATVPAVPGLVLTQALGFTVAFSIEVTRPPSGEWRCVCYKPVAEGDARGLGVWLYPDEMGLRGQLFTVRGPEYADGRAVVGLDRWTHVALVVDRDEMYLYVDGRLDAAIPLEHPVLPVAGPLYLGGGPTGPGFSGLMEDFRVYGAALKPEAIAALAAGR